MKNLAKFLLLSVIPLLFSFRMTVSAVESDGDYLPQGINYLNPDYFFMFKEGGDFYTAEPLALFQIKSNTLYTLKTLNPHLDTLHSLGIVFYDYNRQKLEWSRETIPEMEGDNIVSFRFTTPVGARFMTANIVFHHFADTPPVPIDDFFILHEGENYPPGSDTRYLGPINPDMEPVISGTSGYYFTSVDNPASCETIKAGLRAVDDVDGDITENIIIEEDQYTPNRTILGTYPITFSVTDSSGNKTAFTVYVTVRDVTAPVISGENQFEVSPTELLPVSVIVAELTVSDNYDDNLEIIPETDTYTASYNRLGVYSIVFTTADDSGNRVEFPVTITVVDKISPTFSGPSEIIKSNNSELPLTDILSQITAADDYEGNVTASIQVVSDTYSIHPNRVGIWEIRLSVADSSGNTAYKTVSVAVEDKTCPVFYVDRAVITIELPDNNLTVQSIIGTLMDTATIDSNAKVTVVKDEYTPNKNTPGTYKIVLEADAEMMELSVNVIDSPEIVPEEDSPGFFASLIRFLAKVWEAIVRFFRNLFS